MKDFFKQYWVWAWILVGLFLPLETNATTRYNGGFEFKMATGDYQDGIIYGNAVYPEWITGVVPNSSDYAWIPGATNNGSYYFVRYMNLYFSSDTSFQVGKTYSLDLLVEHGSYLTFSDYYGWRLIPNRNIGYCNGSSQNDLSQCSIQWNPVNDTSSEHMILVFRPNITTSQFSLELGSTDINNNNFVLWNRFGSQQGFRVSTITITEIQNSANPSQDFTDVINAIDNTNLKLDSVNDNLTNINDSLNDDSLDNEDAEDFFGDFEFYDDSSLTSVILAPIDFIESLVDPCQTMYLNYRGTDIPIYCGTAVFWGLPSNDVRTFRAFWNILFGGFLIYKLLVKLVKVVSNAVDPTKDDIGGDVL